MEFDTPVKYFDLTGSVQKLYVRFLEPLCKKWQLSRNELDVMLFLLNHPGVDRAVDISSGRGMAKSYVSQAVTALETRGLLSRSFDPADRRTAHLRLTDQGRAIALEGKQLQQAFHRNLCQGITREEFAMLEAVIDKVSRNIETYTDAN